MSPPRNAKPRKASAKSPAKTRFHPKSKTLLPPLTNPRATSLSDIRDRLEPMCNLLDVVVAALEEGDGALIVEQTASVLFNFVVEPMRVEIQWLDKLIEKHSRAAVS
jgi:hypothetical protein